MKLSKKFNPLIKLYYQPMLIENFKGAAVQHFENDEFLEEFVSFKRRCNILEHPRFIKAYCNVDFPSTVVISADGNIYKCWADIEDKKESIGYLDDWISVADNLFQFDNYHPQNYKCKICKYFPACMGGCKNQTFSSENCNSRKKLILTEIRNYIDYKEVMKNK